MVSERFDAIHGIGLRTYGQEEAVLDRVLRQHRLRQHRGPAQQGFPLAALPGAGAADMTGDLQGPELRSRRHILRKHRNEAPVRRLAEALGWSVVAERAASKRKNVARAVRWEIIPGLTVGYYDEPRAEASCLIVRSVRDIDEVRESEAILKQNLDFFKDSDLLAASRQSELGTKEHILSLLRLGLGAPVSLEQSYFDKLSEAVHSAEPEVRIAALRGMTYTQWLQFRPILGRVATHDSHRDVRELASTLLPVFDRLGPGDEEP